MALGPQSCRSRHAVTFEVEKYLLVGQRVWQLAFTPDESSVHHERRREGRPVYDPGDPEVIKLIGVGRYPWGVVVSNQ